MSSSKSLKKMPSISKGSSKSLRKLKHKMSYKELYLHKKNFNPDDYYIDWSLKGSFISIDDNKSLTRNPSAEGSFSKRKKYEKSKTLNVGHSSCFRSASRAGLNESGLPTERNRNTRYGEFDIDDLDEDERDGIERRLKTSTGQNGEPLLMSDLKASDHARGSAFKKNSLKYGHGENYHTSSDDETSRGYKKSKRNSAIKGDGSSGEIMNFTSSIDQKGNSSSNSKKVSKRTSKTGNDISTNHTRLVKNLKKGEFTNGDQLGSMNVKGDTLTCKDVKGGKDAKGKVQGEGKDEDNEDNSEVKVETKIIGEQMEERNLNEEELRKIKEKNLGSKGNLQEGGDIQGDVNRKGGKLSSLGQDQEGRETLGINKRDLNSLRKALENYKNLSSKGDILNSLGIDEEKLKALLETEDLSSLTPEEVEIIKKLKGLLDNQYSTGVYGGDEMSGKLQSNQLTKNSKEYNDMLAKEGQNSQNLMKNNVGSSNEDISGRGSDNTRNLHQNGSLIKSQTLSEDNKLGKLEGNSSGDGTNRGFYSHRLVTPDKYEIIHQSDEHFDSSGRRHYNLQVSQTEFQIGDYNQFVRKNYPLFSANNIGDQSSSRARGENKTQSEINEINEIILSARKRGKVSKLDLEKIKKEKEEELKKLKEKKEYYHKQRVLSSNKKNQRVISLKDTAISPQKLFVKNKIQPSVFISKYAYVTTDRDLEQTPKRYSTRNQIRGEKSAPRESESNMFKENKEKLMRLSSRLNYSKETERGVLSSDRIHGESHYYLDKLKKDKIETETKLSMSSKKNKKISIKKQTKPKPFVSNVVMPINSLRDLYGYYLSLC